MNDSEERRPWHQQPGESTEWYDRFHAYLMLGSLRTLAASSHLWTGSRSARSSTASKMAKKWNWKERALPYDQAERIEKAALERTRAAVARERRLSRTQKLIDLTTAAIDKADLENLSPEEARTLLPSLRPLLKYALELERLELEVPPLPHDEHPGLDLVEQYHVAVKLLDTYTTMEDEIDPVEEANGSHSQESHADVN